MNIIERIKEGLKNGKQYVIVGIEYVTIGGGEWPEALWAVKITPEEKRLWPMETIEYGWLGKEHHIKFYELDGSLKVHLEETRGMNTNVRVYRYNKETEREETLEPIGRYAVTDKKVYEYLSDECKLTYSIHWV